MCPEVSGGMQQKRKQESIIPSSSTPGNLSAGPSKKTRKGGWLLAVGREQLTVGSDSFLNVCGYFCLVNAQQRVGHAGWVAMCVCVYVWTDMHDRGWENERLPERDWVGGCLWQVCAAKMQNMKQAITAIGCSGSLPSSALSLLPQQMCAPGQRGGAFLGSWGSQPLLTSGECNTWKHCLWLYLSNRQIKPIFWHTLSFTASCRPPSLLRVWPVEGPLVSPAPVSVVRALGEEFVLHNQGNSTKDSDCVPVCWSVRDPGTDTAEPAFARRPFG